jgi:hypothetical protein
MSQHIRRMLMMCAMVVAFTVAGIPTAVGAETVKLYDLSFPEDVAGFTRGETTDFEKDSAGLGYGVSYAKQGWWGDVFIYDMGNESISDDPNSQQVRSHFEQAKAVISMGDYQNVALKRSYTLGDAETTTRFLCASYSFTHPHVGESDSFLCVSSWKNKFVTIRMTVPHHVGSEEEARRFMEAWIEILWPAD